MLIVPLLPCVASEPDVLTLSRRRPPAAGLVPPAFLLGPSPKLGSWMGPLHVPHSGCPHVHIGHTAGHKHQRGERRRLLGCLRTPRIRQGFQALFPNKAKPTRNIDRRFNRKAETAQECFSLYETLCSTPSKARCGRAEHLGGTCVRNQRACLTGKLCGAVPGPIVQQKTSPAHAALP